MPLDDMRNLDDAIIPDLELVKRFSHLQEMGVTGLKRSAGVIDEEFLPALRGRKAVQVFREMSMNDPIIVSLLYTFEQLIKQIEWRVEAAGNTDEEQQAAEFVKSCMDDMSHPWGDMISEIMSMLVYGWSWHEVTYKRRGGPWNTNPKLKSKYADGMYGWRKISIRSQETMHRWIFDDDGGVHAMVQMAPPRYQHVVIPIEKSLLFRPMAYKGSPEGISLLRGAYRPWFFKKRLEEFEAIGVERDLAGMPVAKIPAEYMTAQAGTKEHRTYQAFKKLVSGVRRDEHEGLVLPNQYDRETKQPLFEFELMSSGGARQFDTSSIIQRYEQRMLMTVLADFILVGHQGTGSYALHVDKTGIFRAALNGIAKSVAEVFNRHELPRLFSLNGWKPDELPRIVPNNVDAPDLTQLASFMSGMASMGMEWFPDPELEKFLRNIARLPEMPDEDLEVRQTMHDQQQAMSLAQMDMDSMGMQQKDQMVQAGMTPEQAEQRSQVPTEEMLAEEERATYRGQARAEKDPQVAQMRAREQEQVTQESRGEQDFKREQMEREDGRTQVKEDRTDQRTAAQWEHEERLAAIEEKKERDKAEQAKARSGNGRATPQAKRPPAQKPQATKKQGSKQTSSRRKPQPTKKTEPTKNSEAGALLMTKEEIARLIAGMR